MTLITNIVDINEECFEKSDVYSISIIILILSLVVLIIILLAWILLSEDTFKNNIMLNFFKRYTPIITGLSLLGLTYCPINTYIKLKKNKKIEETELKKDIEI